MPTTECSLLIEVQWNTPKTKENMKSYYMTPSSTCAGIPSSMHHKRNKTWSPRDVMHSDRFHCGISSKGQQLFRDQSPPFTDALIGRGLRHMSSCALQDPVSMTKVRIFTYETSTATKWTILTGNTISNKRVTSEESEWHLRIVSAI